MSSRRDVRNFWDAEVGRWANGDTRLHPDLERWRTAYAGSGDGTIDMNVMPEPYIGRLDGPTPALIMLGLNPGAAAPDFQGPDGIYTRRVRESSYSTWAASGPYSDADWESTRGRNRYQRSRLTFARRLHQNLSLQAKDLLYVELYPFHSKQVTAAMVPPPDLLRRYILEPLSEFETPFVFAFGKPWLDTVKRLGLGNGRELPVDWVTPSRGARVFSLTQTQSLLVMTQRGYAGPPGATDTSALVRALDFTNGTADGGDALHRRLHPPRCPPSRT